MKTNHVILPYNKKLTCYSKKVIHVQIRGVGVDSKLNTDGLSLSRVVQIEYKYFKNRVGEIKNY